jgi:hypothetical protein
MPVARLVICEWAGGSKSDKIIADRTWEQVEAAIRALNNRNLNDLYLRSDKVDPESYLAVGGGSGRYLVTGSVRNERFPTLVDSTRAEDRTESLTVGGQEGDYPESWIVGMDLALRAAMSYWRMGRFDPELDWIDV